MTHPDGSRPSPASSASQQRLKARRSRRSLDSFESYEEFRNYVLRHYAIDNEWIDMIFSGRARIFRYSDGVWICRSGGDCYRLVAKIGKLSINTYRILYSIASEAKTALEISIETGIPYETVYHTLHYFCTVNLVVRMGPIYRLNRSHPQFRTLLMIAKRILGVGKDEG